MTIGFLSSNDELGKVDSHISKLNEIYSSEHVLKSHSISNKAKYFMPSSTRETLNSTDPWFVVLSGTKGYHVPSFHTSFGQFKF